MEKEVTTGSDLVARVRLAIGGMDGVRVFRNNTGLGWVGEMDKARSKMPLLIALRNPRPLHAGLVVGGSDLIGIRSVVVTPDMVGQKHGLFLAAECKDGSGRVTPEQQTFLDFVRVYGGIAGVVRSAEDAVRLIGG